MLIGELFIVYSEAFASAVHVTYNMLFGIQEDMLRRRNWHRERCTFSRNDSTSMWKKTDVVVFWKLQRFIQLWLPSFYIHCTSHHISCARGELAEDKSPNFEHHSSKAGGCSSWGICVFWLPYPLDSSISTSDISHHNGITHVVAMQNLDDQIWKSIISHLHQAEAVQYLHSTLFSVQLWDVFQDVTDLVTVDHVNK